MSISGPRFNELLTNFLGDLSALKKGLDSLDHCPLKEQSQKAFDEVDRQYRLLVQEFPQSIPEEQLNALTLQSAEKLDQVVRELIQHYPALATSFQQDADRLRAHIFNFKPVLEAKEEINKVGLNALLQHPWAREELRDLVFNQNPWALEKLKEFLEKGYDEAFVVLVEHAALHEQCELIQPYLQHPKLSSTIADLLESSEVRQHSALKTLELLLKKTEYPWAYKLLKKKVNENHQAAINTLIEVFLNRETEEKKLHALIIKKLIEGEPWAILAVYRYIEAENNQQSWVAFLADLFNQAKRNTELQFIIISYAVLLSQCFTFQEIFQRELVKFKDLAQKSPLDQRGITDRLENALMNFMDASFGEEDKGFLRWDDLSVLCQINTLRLSLRREHELISLLTNKVNFKIDLGQPISKTFPKINQVLVGPFLTKEKQIHPLIFQMADLLSSYSLPLAMPMSDHLTFPDHPNLYILPSSQDINKWIQDECFIQDKGIAYPALFEDDDDVFELTEREGVSRVEQAPVLEEADLGHELCRPFPMMGGVISCYSQLRLMDAFMQKDSKLKHQKILITFNEGGNYLVGEFEGKRYAVVGKDALIINKHYLGKELADIGLKKNSHGEWELGEPYFEERALLDDEDIRHLMAYDLGLTSPDLLYFVEQPHFHLDMAMVLLDNKRVLLNDSLMVFELMMEYKAMIQELDFYQTNAEILELRIQKYEKKLRQLKLYEDAAAHDLVRQGFHVERIAGSFENIFRQTPKKHRSNFFNFFSITTPEDKKVIFAMGTEEFFRFQFERMVHDRIGQDIIIHFLDREGCEELLSKEGGIHCITKLLKI